MSSNYGTPAGPVEKKVTWASGAAALSGFAVDAIANALRDTDHALLFAGLPEWLEPLLVALLAGLPSFLAGYQAPHTHRPDLRGGPAL